MTSSDVLQKATQYIAEYLSEAIQELIYLCSFPSIATDTEGIETCAAAVVRSLEGIGAETRILRVPGGHPAVYGLVRGNAPRTLLFFNHYDVESAGSLDKWLTPPFSPEVRDDKLFGRGTADNKGSFLTRVWAIRALKETMGSVPFNLAFLVEAKKAIFAPHLGMILENYPELFQVEACLWENALNDRSGRPTLRLGDKGMFAVELISEGNAVDLSSQVAGVVPSAAWDLVHALKTLISPDGRILLEGFYDQVEKPTTTERGWVHDLPLEYEEIERAWGGDPKVASKAREKLFLEPTCNIGRLTAGPTVAGEKRMSLIPRQASALLDFRLVPNQNPDVIYQQLCAHLAQRGFTEIKVNHLGGFPAHKTTVNNTLVQALTRASLKVHRCPPRYEPLASASSMRCLFAQRRPIPIVGVGIGYPESNIGRPNEHIRLRDFQKGIEYITATILEYA